MSNSGKIISKAEKEINAKIKDEKAIIKKLNEESEELKVSIKGYMDFYENLKSFITESMVDFTVNEEDIGSYFKSNLNEVYKNYMNIKEDASAEIKNLEKYIDIQTKNKQKTKNSLKFYRSQDLESDFFKVCLPLVTFYETKITIIDENINLTKEVIEILTSIYDKINSWN